jgi:hypothetical protein
LYIFFFIRSIKQSPTASTHVTQHSISDGQKPRTGSKHQNNVCIICARVQ